MELRKNIGNILMTKWRETLDRDDEDKKKKGLGEIWWNNEGGWKISL